MVLTATACLFGAASANAEDQLDQILQRGGIPSEHVQRPGYSDFTSPLGRFLDLLAAGDVAGARSIQPDACAAWAATRHTSGWTGTFWVWNVKLDLDSLCSQR